MNHIAAIDIGTNTVRLLIAAAERGRITPVVTRRVVTRLGGGFSREAGISPDAWHRTIDALADFSAELRMYPGIPLRAAATSAVRDAANGSAFCSEVKARTGIDVEVIDGEEEARLTLEGVLSGIDANTSNFMVFDIGGGSTEYIVARNGVPVFSRSLPLGVVRLTEGWGTVPEMEERIRTKLSPLCREMADESALPDSLDTTLVATAGTATTLAAIDLKMIDYDYRKVNNHTLPLQKILEIQKLLLSLTPAERLAVPGLEKGREDLIIAGTLIVVQTMTAFCFDRLKISDFGLLEGVALSVAHRSASF